MARNIFLENVYNPRFFILSRYFCQNLCVCVCVGGGDTKTQLKPNIHSILSNIRAKHSRGCKHLFKHFVMCIKCNIFNSILIFMSNIWEVETYFWEMCTTQCFWFYPDICANHLGGRGLQHISGMCINPIAKIEWSMWTEVWDGGRWYRSHPFQVHNGHPTEIPPKSHPKERGVL